MKEIDLPEHLRESAAVVTDVTPDDLEHYLDAQELARAAQFRLERRRLEWAAARIAARVVAMRRGVITDASALSIGTRDACPFGRTMDGREWSLSLSHSGLAGAAAIGDGRVGVDIERPRRVNVGAVRFFLSDHEIARFESCELHDAVIHFWSAKEAAFKAAPAAALLRQVRFDEIEVGSGGLSARWSDGKHQGTVETALTSDGLVVALAKESGRNE